MSTIGAKGAVGTQRVPNPIPILNSNSESLSPRVQVDRSIQFQWIYDGYGNGPPVTRFLIPLTPANTHAFSLEAAIIRLAIDHLRDVRIQSANTLCGISSPRPSPGNVVLVDIADNKKQPHTVCLWKREDDDFLLIDPSSTSFSSRLKSPAGTIPPRIHVKQNAKDKFYQKIDQKNPPNKPAAQDGNIENKADRDCVDVALKIAFTINKAQLFASSIFSIEDRINHLSNQKAVNPLLQYGGESVGWLQNADPLEREETVHLFLANKDYLQFVQVSNFNDLREVNERLRTILQSVEGASHSDLVEVMKEHRQGKFTMDQFRICCPLLQEMLSAFLAEHSATQAKRSAVDKMKEELKRAKGP